MRRKVHVALGLLTLFVLCGCGSDRKGYVNVVSSDNLDFTAVAGGFTTPVHVVTLQMSPTESGPDFTCPYLEYVLTTSGFFGYWHFPPYRDLLIRCQPQSAIAGTYSGTVRIKVSNVGYLYAEAVLPVQVEILDAPSSPFPGFMKNSAQDITYFDFVVPSGTPGLTTQTLEIVNQGGGTLNWSIVSNQPWLSVAPYQGDTTIETDVVNVNVNVAGLTSLTYYVGALTFACDSPYVAQEKIYVVLYVGN